VKINYDERDNLPERFLGILRAMSYKPGWVLDAYLISWPGMYKPGAKDFEVRVSPRLIITDVNTGAEAQLVGHPVSFNTSFSERQIIDLVFFAIRHTEIHEAEEWFTYNGHRVYNPHRSPFENAKVFDLALTEAISECRLQTGSETADTSSAPNSDTTASKERRPRACPSHE
jgi:hypothetical protein